MPNENPLIIAAVRFYRPKVESTVGSIAKLVELYWACGAVVSLRIRLERIA